MKKPNDDFCAGVLVALAVLDQYGKDEIYDAIVAEVDGAELVDFARRDKAMRWSGLTKHGYGKKFPAPKRDRAEEAETDARLVAILVEALRANEDKTAWPAKIMDAAIEAQGLRRATWATIPELRRERIRRRAMREWRKDKDG